MSEEYRILDLPILGVTYGRSYNSNLITSGPIVEPEVPDTTAPVVDNFNPPIGTAIARTDYVQFDVTDDACEFTIIIVLARFTNGTCECVWDGDAFTAFYLAGSSKVAIDCGWRYTVRRAGGWLTTPVSIQAIAIDRACNIGRGTL